MIGLLTSNPVAFFLIVIALVLSIGFHEFFHVLAAYLMGDRTGKQMGRLTLNPLAHLDPLGTISLFLIGFGWGKPAPFNPYNLRYHRWGPALVAIAGPFSNLLLILVFGTILKIVYSFLPSENVLVLFLQIFVFFNGILMVFNLIPIPPLDGSHILRGLLGPTAPRFVEKLDYFGPRILLGLVFISIILNIPIFGYVISPIIDFISRTLGVPLFF